jgi:hypothetical protein
MLFAAVVLYRQLVESKDETTTVGRRNRNPLVNTIFKVYRLIGEGRPRCLASCCCSYVSIYHHKRKCRYNRETWSDSTEREHSNWWAGL